MRGSNDSLANAPIIRLDTYEFSYKTVIDPISGVASVPKLDVLSATANYARERFIGLHRRVKNKTFARGVLTQRDSNGDAVSAWVMTSLQVLNERVISDTGLTTEDLQFSFRQITEASYINDCFLGYGRCRTGGPFPSEINLSPYAAPSSFSELQFIPEIDRYHAHDDFETE